MQKRLIEKIRKEVLNGKSKYGVAKELGLSDSIVYYHTRDIPSKSPGRSEIRGKTLDLLKQLLQDGYVYGQRHTSSQFRTLRKHFPVIKRAEFDKRTVFFLEDKNKAALSAMISQKKSRVISYRDISNISKVFNVGLKMNEKHQLLGRNKSKKQRKNHSSQDDSLRENDGSLAFFYIRRYCDTMFIIFIKYN
ncbi:MAG: hypothetical protein R6V50_05175 [Thermoplasmatota archaeon]